MTFDLGCGRELRLFLRRAMLVWVRKNKGKVLLACILVAGEWLPLFSSINTLRMLDVLSISRRRLRWRALCAAV